MEPRKVRILGRPVHVADLPRAMDYLATQIERGVKQFVIAQNPVKLMRCRADEELSDIVESKATLLVADGVGLVIAARLLGLGPIPRLTGIRLFGELLGLASARGKRVFLYGSAPDVCLRVAENVRRGYPGLEVAGTQHGYEHDHALVLRRIREAEPDFLFAALGTPRQEKWIARHLDELPLQCAMGVGGSFDVVAGAVRRAPIPMQRAGLEWLHRIVKQPSRARRMPILANFLWMVVKSRATSGGASRAGAP